MKWYTWNTWSRRTIAFHSKDHSHELPRFHHRTRLSGDLKDGDCSLIINNIRREDAGYYFFKIEFDSRNSYSYYPETQLHVSVGQSQEWKGDTPREVTAQEGSCVQIPCHYSYPSCLENQPRGGVWFNNEERGTSSIAFHSKDHSHELPRFHNRTRLSGDLKDGDCSLIINNIRREDAGPYYFRIEFDSSNSYSYYPVTQLHVSDFTDKPMVFPAEIIAGKPVDVSCTFNTTCNGTAAPVLTWDTPTDVPGSVSNTVTQHGVTLTYTSVLTLIPSLKHHGHTLSCRVRYPSVSSERTLVLTVQGRDSSKWTVGLLTAGIMLSVFLAGIFIFICVRRRKTAMEERVSGTSDIALTPSPLSVKHQGKQNVLITEPRNTTRDTTSEEETPAPRGLSDGAVRGDAGHWHTDNPDALLYASPQVLRVPSGDGSVHREEETEYAQIRKKTATQERVSGTRDIALTPSPLSVKHQGKQNVLITEPGNTTRDTTSEGETPAPRDLSEGPVGGDAGHGNPDNPDDFLYANPQVFRVPSGDGTVHREEETEYAQIRFK
ncbi:uncharacterized protein LOC121274079 [Carcharodon carcharias]|uniref:uncharacterized protein LOC121274079 n=1 Tax=Carcharodon carcharias TaxID=13397 RepID=UPI001B7DD861|nr:uncharacterized protein LOC121274079 [Carcharodon carcharias]